MPALQPGNYAIPQAMQERFARDFVYRVPDPDQVERYQHLIDEVHMLARFICANTPASRDQSLALTSVEEALFWASAAIARNE